MILGITGGTGSGKTTLLKMVEDLGGLVLDCDQIYHQLLLTDHDLLTAIETRFPNTVEAGILQRKKLGSIVFSDPAALQDLNALTHEAVKQEVQRQLTPEPPLAAIDAIGLFESGLDKLCKLTVAVTAQQKDRIARLMVRDGIDEEYALARIRAQLPQAVYAERSDYTLCNDSTPEAFRRKCLAFFQEVGIIKEKP